MNLYIILPVHNRRQVTLEFIHCLQQQTCQTYSLILVDDGSTDGTADAVMSALPDCKLIQGNGQLWWAACVNKAIDWLYANNADDNSVILIINDDTHFNADFLQQALTCMAENPDSLLLARKQEHTAGEVEETGLHLDIDNMNFYPASENRGINCLSTRGLFLFWKDLKKIGKLKEKWLPHYGSDMEFTYRAYRLGYRLTTDPRVYLIHDKRNTNYKFNLPDNVPLKVLFSQRYDMNPIMLTRLAIVISPLHLMLPNIFRVWYRTFKSMLHKTTS